jgi:hypothetical protein
MVRLLTDFGHNIVCILEEDYQEGEDLKKFLVPAPVKAVLREYSMRNGYVVVNLPYDAQEGLLISPEDEEF